MKTATKCVHWLGGDEDAYGAMVPPIYQTATFRQPNAVEFGEYDYTRTANPTRTLLERQLAALEEGAYAAAFASGMAATTALVRLLDSGDEILAGDDLYGGTVRLFERVLPRQGIKVRYVDATDPAAVRAAISVHTRMLLIETPSNPLMRIADIEALADVAHRAGAWLVVDNSMLSPCLQRPLRHGADVVIHSATKFLCGHSDVTAGALITNDAGLYERIAFQQNAEGAGLSPFESWLLLRGLKTLALRVERQNASAERIAEYLSRHKAVKRVFYPGLGTHPGREVHRRQATGNGAVISFTTGDAELSRRVAESARLFAIAVSFGSVNSSISLPCYMSHASVPEDLRAQLGPPADLVRISVGIEDVEDLIEDLDRAFTIAARLAERCAASIGK
ncbi:MAG: cystathionine gamma-synthase [Pyrinomonas sp.]|uniref:trans-sulfuration enzyme family protein n=1 Tax=Pyrinomonas sp. TaxID=2080306 RepID=UPI00333110B8